MEDKNLSQQESLHLITEMIRKAKKGVHERGTSAILWGSVVALCGLTSFAELYWNFHIGFDVWLLTLAAFIPQAFITIRERRQRTVVTHTEAAMNAIWSVYAISIFALIFYFNTVPSATDRLLAEEGSSLSITQNGTTRSFRYFIASSGSLLLLLYAIPTMATGLAHRFRPMLWGALLCYGFFILSCFVSTTYDMLLNGLAGIFNWLIPGLILRRRYLREKTAAHV